ncbi:transposase [Turicibacter sanguinis]|uniref:transposase n=1 Tax=Turicibacter sanguinis TaxID=154288 RepID=UPI002943E50C|nr:transposase [Turicibacter sanguinis]
MAKYSPGFKLHVVNEYLQGTLGYRLLAKKYQMSSPSPIKAWVRQYTQNGKSRLERKENQEYTGEFKLNVLN